MPSILESPEERKKLSNYVGLREEVHDSFAGSSTLQPGTDEENQTRGSRSYLTKNHSPPVLGNPNRLAVPATVGSRIALLRKSSSKSRAKVTESLSVPLNKMSLKLYGSKKAVQEEQERVKQAGAWIIHPYSNFRLLWDSLTLILLLINITLIPVAIAFWKVDHPTWLPFKVNFYETTSKIVRFKKNFFIIFLMPSKSKA